MTLQERAEKQKRKIGFLNELKKKKSAIDKMEVKGYYQGDPPVLLRVKLCLVNDKGKIIESFNDNWHPVAQIRGQLQNSLDHMIRVVEKEIADLELP